MRIKDSEAASELASGATWCRFKAAVGGSIAVLYGWAAIAEASSEDPRPLAVIATVGISAVGGLITLGNLTEARIYDGAASQVLASEVIKQQTLQPPVQTPIN